MSPSDREAQLYPQAPGSLSVAFYDSQGYGGDILTLPHTGIYTYILERTVDRKLLRRTLYFIL
jgi:hypothetical protein